MCEESVGEPGTNVIVVQRLRQRLTGIAHFFGNPRQGVLMLARPLQNAASVVHINPIRQENCIFLFIIFKNTVQ
jgi:hypothetical protein